MTAFDLFDLAEANRERCRNLVKKMDCPKCGYDCYRDEVDVGVGIMYGPYGCMCGWSEDPRYDSSEGESDEQKKHPDYIVDSCGGMLLKEGVMEKLEHFGIDTTNIDL